MKKLLIAMSAAAMFSLCAKADTTPTLLGSMDFETGYSAGDSISTDAADPEGDSELHFWAGSSGESLIAVEGEGSSANKYLKVDTTETLVRQTAEQGASAIAPVSITNADVIVSSKVQFTAADEAPTPEDGDKLVVWMRAAAEAEGTDGEPGYVPAVSAAVMVTDKDGPNVLTTIAAEDVESFTAAWHTLAIKAVKAGTEAQPTASFTVTLDGTDYGPYKSLVTGGANSQTIASIGFKGTGAVDNIVFAKNEAAPPVPVELSCTVNGGADSEGLVTIQDANGDTVDTANVGDTLTIIVAAQQTDSVTCAGLTFHWVSDEQNEAFIATYTLTADDGVAGTKAFAITVTEGGAGAIVPNMAGVPATVTFSPEFAESYTAGQKIDPTKITASTSKPGYTVSFEISVNGTPIMAETTLAAGDTVTVTATETAIEYTITYTYADANSNPLTDVENTNPSTFTVTNAVVFDTTKISKAGYTVTSVNPASIAQGTTGNQTVAVVLTAVPTYTVTAAAVEGATVTFSTNTAVVSGTTVTFTIAVTDETKEIDTVKNGETELTANEGVYSVTVADANIVITVTLKNKTTPAGDWPAAWNNGAAATPAQAAAFTEWAKTNDATAANAQAAFLTGQDVATYKEVTFTSITIADNKVVLTENVDLSKANGVVKIKYGTTPTSLTNTAELGAELPATAAAQFYQIVVDFQ